MNSIQFQNLDAFTRAFIQTALWASADDNEEQLESNYGPSDLASETSARIVKECAEFQRENAGLISAAIETGEVKCGPDFDEYGRAGHDFWLTRNGDGCGFWDGDWPEPYGDQLTEASKRFPEVSLYVGDDGLIYLA